MAKKVITKYTFFRTVYTFKVASIGYCGYIYIYIHIHNYIIPLVLHLIPL